MTDDPVAVLLKAFPEWDAAAEAMGERERRSKGKDKPGGITLDYLTRAKEAAIHALGIDCARFHRAVAEARQQHIAGDPDHHGMTTHDAVVTALIDMGVDVDPQFKEAS